MQFKSYTIAPKGRNKYGTYVSGGNITKMVTTTTYGGNGSNGGSTGGSTGGGNSTGTTTDNWLLFLSKTSGSYKGEAIALGDITEEIELIGFRGDSRTQTFIGSITTAKDESGSTYYAYTEGITGIPAGMEVKVEGNYTTSTKLKITLTKDIAVTSGTLTIPCNIHIKEGTLEAEVEDWGDNLSEVTSMNLEFSFDISTNATSSYILDLTNEIAAVNCDKDWNVLTGATKPECTAALYYGKDKITGITYSVSTKSEQAVSGLSIDGSTGVLSFATDFNFIGTSLDITVSTVYMGQTFSKIMSISKQYPGEDGNAITRWLVVDANSITYNPNGTAALPSPSTVNAKVMKQVNAEEPVQDTETKIFWGWDTQTPVANSGYTVTVATTTAAAHSYLFFALYNNKGVIYESESVPVLQDGLNGKDGASAYRMDLTNENANINCDSEGNILAGAARPSCTATLYYGKDRVDDAVYSFTASVAYSGLSIDNSTGVLTFNKGTSATPFNFNGTSIEITITAKVDGTPLGAAVMTVSKNLAGSDGEPAVSYWLSLNANKIKVDTNNSDKCSPTTITATAYMQVGEATPVTAEGVTIYWGTNTSASNVYSGAITTKTYSSYDSLTFKLMKGSVQVDLESVPYLREGKNGKDGEQGRQGAAVRGPVQYENQTYSRRYCNGIYNPNDSSSLESDAEFIDVIARKGSDGNNVFYYCNTSYTSYSNPTTDWNSHSSYWTQSDKQFDFVAAYLLLANYAKINFLTGQGIYLGDKDGNIAAGIEGATASGETDTGSTILWIGGENPSEANFKVDYSGNMTAKSGTFYGYVQMPYTYIDELVPNYKLTNSTIGTKYVTDCTYKGRFSSAPSSPSTGWLYYNTSSGSWYYYRNSWYLMSNSYSSNGYIADKHCNIMVDSSAADYGMFDGADLILPNPSAEYDGMTYHIIMQPNPATKSTGENHSVGVRTISTSYTFRMYFHGSTIHYNQPYAVRAFGGYMTITCIPTSSSRSSYTWCITECTGGGDCYDSSGNNIWAFGNVYSYNSKDSDGWSKSNYCINRVVAQSSFSSSDSATDTLKITR